MIFNVRLIIFNRAPMIFIVKPITFNVGLKILVAALMILIVQPIILIG